MIHRKDRKIQLCHHYDNEIGIISKISVPTYAKNTEEDFKSGKWKGQYFIFSNCNKLDGGWKTSIFSFRGYKYCWCLWGDDPTFYGDIINRKCKQKLYKL